MNRQDASRRERLNPGFSSVSQASFGDAPRRRPRAERNIIEQIHALGPALVDHSYRVPKAGAAFDWPEVLEDRRILADLGPIFGLRFGMNLVGACAEFHGHDRLHAHLCRRAGALDTPSINSVSGEKQINDRSTRALERGRLKRSASHRSAIAIPTALPIPLSFRHPGFLQLGFEVAADHAASRGPISNRIP